MEDGEREKNKQLNQFTYYIHLQLSYQDECYQMLSVTVNNQMQRTSFTYQKLY